MKKKIKKWCTQTKITPIKTHLLSQKMFKQKLNLGQKLTKTVKEPRNSKCDNSKNQLGQNSKTQIVTKLKKKKN